ncbi:hypothetical protein ACEPPN_001513 [Leptodophora sp. 'Broadleaf-Isolate-01']
MGAGNPEPQLQDVLHTPTSKFQSCVAAFDTYRNFDPGHNLRIYTSMPNDTTPNRFIDKLQAGKKSPARFTGPLTVLAFDRAGSVTEVRIPRDITLEDVRLAIDYFAHGDEPLHGQWLSLWNQCGRTGQVLGVKIHCDAELNEEKFQAVNVPKNHPVFENCSTPISIAMNLPLKMWIYPHINVGGGSAYLNVEASSMNRITNVTDKRWGEVPEEWKCEVGSVLVVRQDGKNLKAGEVKALATFCTDVLDVLISQTKSGVGYSRECLVQEFMDRNTFELWLSARNVSMKRGGVDEGMMNPYDGLGADEGRVEDMEMTDVLMLDTAARSSDFLKVIRRGTPPMSRNFAFQKLVLRRGLSGAIRQTDNRISS